MASILKITNHFFNNIESTFPHSRIFNRLDFWWRYFPSELPRSASPKSKQHSSAHIHHPNIFQVRHPWLLGQSLVTSEACLSASGAFHPAVSKFITVIRLRLGEAGTGWAWGLFPADTPGESQAADDFPGRSPKQPAHNDGPTLLLFG